MGGVSQGRNLQFFSSPPKILESTHMKTKKPPVTVELPQGVTVTPALDDKYVGQQPFQDKIDRSNYILKTVGLPKAEVWEQAAEK